MHKISVVIINTEKRLQLGSKFNIHNSLRYVIMNKVLKSLLVTALAVSAAQVDAHTNKTFLMPRSQGVQLPMEYTTFHELVSRKDEDKFGGNFQVTGIYSASSDNDDIGKYFLTGNKDKISLIRSTASDESNATTGDLDLNYIIHKKDGVATDPEATVSLRPEQNFYGVRFDYHQELDRILKGLYLSAHLPVIHVENKTKLNVTSADATLQTNVMNFFNGTFANTTASDSNRQAKLANAKMVNSDDTGVADIDIALGYKFLRKEKYHAALAIAVTIPTGEEADGSTLFEAVVGNGKHFGLGGDFCGGARIWGDMDHNIKLAIKMKYRYLFENSEKRTLGIKGYNMGQYALLVAPTATGADATLVPAANVTTLNVDVTPGSQLDGMVAFAYNNGGFSFDLGYNMYFREAEDVDMKDAFVAGSYAVAAQKLDTKASSHNSLPATGVFTTGVNDVTDGGAAALTSAIISKDTLDVTAAETPSQFTHTIFAGLGYTFKEWDNPLMLGVGGKYEFASKNSALEMWGIWAKIGIGF